MPSGPNSLESIMENMKPSVPVVRLDKVSISEFLKKLSFFIVKQNAP